MFAPPMQREVDYSQSKLVTVAVSVLHIVKPTYKIHKIVSMHVDVCRIEQAWCTSKLVFQKNNIILFNFL